MYMELCLEISRYRFGYIFDIIKYIMSKGLNIQKKSTAFSIKVYLKFLNNYLNQTFFILFIWFFLNILYLDP